MFVRPRSGGSDFLDPQRRSRIVLDSPSWVTLLSGACPEFSPQPLRYRRTAKVGQHKLIPERAKAVTRRRASHPARQSQAVGLPDRRPRGNRTNRHVYLWDRLLGSLHQVSDLHHNFAASFAGQRTVERLARLF